MMANNRCLESSRTLWNFGWYRVRTPKPKVLTLETGETRKGWSAMTIKIDGLELEVQTSGIVHSSGEHVSFVLENEKDNPKNPASLPETCCAGRAGWS
jgi:hypothetical protein